MSDNDYTAERGGQRSLTDFATDGGRLLPTKGLSSSIPSLVTVGADIVVTRPADTTAYALGDVWGPAADARIAIPIPAAPVFSEGKDAEYYLAAMTLQTMRSGANFLASSPTLSLSVMLFSAQPATVIGDNALLELSDADVALILRNNAGNAWILQAGISISAATVFNYGAAGKIRAGGSPTFTPAGDSGGVGRVGQSLPTNTTLYAYLFHTATQTPTSEEKLTFTPRFNWLQK